MRSLIPEGKASEAERTKYLSRFHKFIQADMPVCRIESMIHFAYGAFLNSLDSDSNYVNQGIHLIQHMNHYLIPIRLSPD